MLYLVIAKDANDAQAGYRRRQARPVHIKALTNVVQEGRVKLAGAILDEAGAATGSALLVEAASEAEVRELLECDVYSRDRVWERFEIYPFKQAF